MCNLRICRICLRTEAKLFKFDRFQLLYYYEEVMALEVNEKDGLPHYFCYECATMLHKFHKFKEKCYSGQKALKEILRKGPLTYESIYKIDRNSLNLQSPLSIHKFPAYSTNVKTYSTTDDTEVDIKEEQSVGYEETNYNSSFSDCDDNQEMSMDEANLADEKPLFASENTDTDPNSEKPFESTAIFVAELNQSSEKLTQTGNDPEMVTKKKRRRQTAVFIDESIDSADKSIAQEDDSDTELIFLKKQKQLPPTTVVKDELVEESKGTTVAIIHNAKKYISTSKKTRFLDASHWKKFNLSEEEAVNSFRARAEDQKYLAAAFKCTDCFKGFSKEDMLKRHKRWRHNEEIGEHECRFCRMRFKWEYALRKHMHNHFTKYQCLRCDLICLAENTALLHDEYHNGIIRKCIHCNEEFRHISTFYTHMRTHRSEHVCPLCGVSFVSAAGLQQHKMLKHINNEMESPDDDEEVNTFCEKCDIRFETRKAYKKHLFHSAMHMEGVDYTTINEYSLPKKTRGKKAQKQITIELRNDKNEDQKLPPMKTSRGKKQHSRVPRKPTICYQCGKHFETQAACHRHHLAEHPGTSFFSPNDRHICEICGASLAVGSVAAHMNKHTQSKMYTCDTCGRSFTTRTLLKQHIVVHTGERKYVCNVCGKRFTQNGSLSLHVRTFHLKQPYPKRNRKKVKKEDDDSMAMSAACSKALGPKYVPTK